MWDPPGLMDAELQAAYEEAWGLYYTREHIETLLKRAAVTKVPMMSLAKVLVQFTTMMQLEKVHPLQSGVIRMKHPSERRPGFPREGTLAFYSRYLGNLITRNARFIGTVFWILSMKRRIERQIEQRTTMLAGVSHDMRTVLTRFKLELALLEDSPEIEALRRDVDELQRMLEAYLAFARGDAGEQPGLVDISEMLGQFAAETERRGKRTSVTFSGPPIVQVRADSFKRCVANLVANASRYGSVIALSGTREPRWLSWIERVDAYAFSHFADPEYGEWFGYCDRQGNLTSTAKGNNYKGCFHVPRMLLLSYQVLTRV